MSGHSLRLPACLALAEPNFNQYGTWFAGLASLYAD
jgi:hypothetical protein